MIRLRNVNGLDLDLGATPTREVTVTPPVAALLGADYPGVRPELAVGEGDAVRRGDVLFVDRARSEIRFTAPAAGRVRAVRLGARRRLESVEIEVDPDQDDPPVLDRAPAAGPEATREALLRAGLWPALRRRPDDRIPAPEERVSMLFVTALDTEALALDPAPIIRERRDAFREGVTRLAGLVDACYVCMAADADLPCPEVTGVEPVLVSGPHPAGLPGTHIYGVARQLGHRWPPSPVWHVGYQDVIAIGTLFLDGRLDTARTVSAAGPGLGQAARVTTLLGASLSSLTGDVPDGARVVSGPVLSGRAVGRTTAYLGRYHHQVVVVPGASPAAPPDQTGMLALEAFERVWPLGVPVLPLLRAVLIEDTETVVALGGAHLAPEDLALCAYVCPARLDYGAALERTLDTIRRGG